jgi:phospholipase C
MLRAGSIALFCALLVGVALPSSPARAGLEPTGLSKLKHLIFIIQENRSFDNYFGTYPGAAGFPSPLPCLPSMWYPSQCFPPFADHSDSNAGGPYDNEYQLSDIDGGAMDGFVIEREKELKNSKCKPQDVGTNKLVVMNDDEVGPLLAKCTMDVMGYHDGSDLPNYWAYAQQYVLMDHFFESIHSQSHPSHLAIFSMWSAKCAQLNPPDVNSCVADGQPGNIWGQKGYNEPYLWTDITYLLWQNSIDWRVYLDGGLGNLHDHNKVGAIWDVLPGFEKVQEDGQVGNAENYLLPDFFNDAAAGTLPPVSWVLPHYYDSEHPQASIAAGQTYTTSLINAVMSGPAWKDSAIFIVWDDMGGFYDNMAPPFSFDTLGLGIRVPSLLISPYAKKNFIDHQVCSTDCYLKLVEDVFIGGARLSSTGRPDPRADYRDEQTAYGDLANDFDFVQQPRPPMLLSTHPMTMLRKEPTPPTVRYIRR